MARRKRVVVRRIREGEASLLREVRLELLREEPWRAHLLTEELARTTADWEERARRGAASDTFATFVAVERVGWIGVADGVAIDERTVDVAGTWVEPARRCRGVGTALVGAIEEWARARSAVRLGLWVVETNSAAIALYVKTDFTRTAPLVPVSTSPDLRQIRMVRDLVAPVRARPGGTAVPCESR